MQEEDLEQAIDIALSGEPRATALGDMIDALRARRAALVRDREAATDDAKRQDIEARIRETDKQLERLTQERAIAQFVEFTVRSSALRERPDDEAPDEAEEE